MITCGGILQRWGVRCWGPASALVAEHGYTASWPAIGIRESGWLFWSEKNKSDAPIGYALRCNARTARFTLASSTLFVCIARFSMRKSVS